MAWTPREQSMRNLQVQSLGADRSFQPEQQRQPLLAHATSRGSSQPSQVTPATSPSAAGFVNRVGSGRAEDIVQFSSPIYYAEEQEGEVTLDLMRMGPCQGAVSVHFETVDGSGKAGSRYEAKSGVINFADGQSSASIQVAIVDSRNWTATLEFKVQLKEPNGCQLGLYLKQCRIKVIDSDTFPSNKHGTEIKEGKEAINEIDGASLIIEFLKLAMEVDGVMWRTIAIGLLDQTKNIYLYFTLTINVYLVDVLFADDPGTVALLPGLEVSLLVPGEKGASAALLGILYFLPMLAMHTLDVSKVLMDLRGRIGSWLRANLVRKYLNYSESSRAQVTNSHIQLAMLQETSTISEGVIAVLRLCRQFGKVAVVMFFAYERSPTAIKFLVLMPVLMVVWAVLRMRVYVEAQAKHGDKQLEIVDFINEFCAKYELIAEYFQRPQIGEHFEEKQKEFCQVTIPMQLIYMNNYYVQKSMGPMFTGMYIALEAKAVLEPDSGVSLGTFLTTSGLFVGVAGTFLKVYDLGLAVHAMLLPLRTLTFYLNLATDLPQLKKMNRQRRELTKTERQKAREQLAKMGGDGVAVDQIPIKLVKLCFSYVPRKPVFTDLSVSVPQGNLVAVVSEYDDIGRSTLLKLLGQRCFPNDGMVFIPSHLRVLHVSNMPTLLDRTIWKNLTFGALDAPESRVIDILKEMKMHQVVDIVRHELEEEARNKEELRDKPTPRSHDTPITDHGMNNTTIAKLHLARGLIMNPEVIVLQRPLTFYDQVSASRADILRAIKKHVANRGLGLDPETVSKRRPRTCFFTAENMIEAEEADIIWNILEDGQIEVIPGKGGAGTGMPYMSSPSGSYAPSKEAFSRVGSPRQEDVLYEEDAPQLSDRRRYQESVMVENNALAQRLQELEGDLVSLEQENQRFRDRAGGGAVFESTMAPHEDRHQPMMDSRSKEELQKESRRLNQVLRDEQVRCEDLVHEIAELRQRAIKAEARAQHGQQAVEKLRRQLAEERVAWSESGVPHGIKEKGRRYQDSAMSEASQKHRQADTTDLVMEPKLRACRVCVN